MDPYSLKALGDQKIAEDRVYGQQEQSAYDGPSNRPATVRCCCSIGRATVWR